jgi:branched-chain amino acid transport system substrate-binding protein
MPWGEQTAVFSADLGGRHPGARINRGWLFAVIAGLLLGLAPAAWSQEVKPILLGATVSLEGKYREPSLMIKDVLNLWETQVNQRGGLLGRPVKLVLYDDRSKEELVRRFYQQMVQEDRVDLTFSPYSSELTLAASEITERHQKIMMAATASAEIVWQRDYKYIFGVIAPAGRYMIGFLDLMARHGLESAAILHDRSPFNASAALGAKDWASRFGIKISYMQAYSQEEKDLPKILTQALATRPQGLILCAYPEDCYKFLKLLQTAESRPPALCLTVGPALPAFYQIAGSAAEEVFGPSHWEPDTRVPFPGNREFVESFQNLTRRPPSYHAGAVFAACQVLERAITQTASLDPEKLRNYILSLDTVTVIGRFRLDASGMQIGHNPMLIQWQNGKKEIVYPANMQTAPARFSPTRR